MRCIPPGRRGSVHCKSNCEDHAGSDIKLFENTTLINYRIECILTKEKVILKTLVLNREANTLPQ